MVAVVGRREDLRAAMIERAQADRRITGAAITGSAASGRQDGWSDIDLFFGVAAGVALEAVLADWSDFVYRDLGGLHHFDLHAADSTIYRAFVLADLLEIDLAFAPAPHFGPRGTGVFNVVFGDAVERRPSPSLDIAHLIGLSWHHVLHARNAIERGAVWEAEYWVSALRGQTIALACHRLGLPTHYAKGADELPVTLRSQLEATLVCRLDSGELRRAHQAATRAFLTELRQTDPQAHATIEPSLLTLLEPTDP
jgi:hypothetical protein